MLQVAVLLFSVALFAQEKTVFVKRESGGVEAILLSQGDSIYEFPANLESVPGSPEQKLDLLMHKVEYYAIPFVQRNTPENSWVPFTPVREVVGLDTIRLSGDNRLDVYPGVVKIRINESMTQRLRILFYLPSLVFVLGWGFLLWGLKEKRRLDYMVAIFLIAFPLFCLLLVQMIPRSEHLHSLNIPIVILNISFLSVHILLLKICTAKQKKWDAKRRAINAGPTIASLIMLMMGCSITALSQDTPHKREILSTPMIVADIVVDSVLAARQEAFKQQVDTTTTVQAKSTVPQRQGSSGLTIVSFIACAVVAWYILYRASASSHREDVSESTMPDYQNHQT